MSAISIEAEFDAVSYWYPGELQAVLDEVGWQIERGSFVVLAGPSGSGKSTMLRCLNGLVPHFSGGRMAGAVHVRGLDTRDHGPRSLSQSVGFVFQDPEAQAVADIVEDDIAFGLEQAGLPRQTMRKRVEGCSICSASRRSDVVQFQLFREGNGNEWRSPPHSCFNRRCWCSMNRPASLIPGAQRMC